MSEDPEYLWVELGSAGLGSYTWSDSTGRIERMKADDLDSAQRTLVRTLGREGWWPVRAEEGQCVFRRSKA